jgi:hypothetical protein
MKRRRSAAAVVVVVLVAHQDRGHLIGGMPVGGVLR